MASVLTLIGNPENSALTDTMVRAIARRLPVIGEPDWLDARISCDIFFDESAIRATEAIAFARDELNDAPIDLGVTREQSRRKRLLMADMDLTIINKECINELAAELDIEDQVAEITERAMHGEIDFEPALRERVALLKGLDVNVFARVYRHRVALNPGARTLVQTMRANGAYCSLVSGGFTAFSERVAADAGFHEHRANRLEIKNGLLTGRVLEPVVDPQTKLLHMLALVQEFRIDPALTLAVGDGANDVPMIRYASIGAAYNAKPFVSQEADLHIVHSDLTALLYFQGYRREEFVY